MEIVRLKSLVNKLCRTTFGRKKITSNNKKKIRIFIALAIIHNEFKL
jgi:hypothetical protein